MSSKWHENQSCMLLLINGKSNQEQSRSGTSRTCRTSENEIPFREINKASWKRMEEIGLEVIQHIRVNANGR